LKINGIEIKFHVDYIERIIHLFDVNSSHIQSLVNNISPSFQKDLIQQGQLLLDVLDFEWVCYSLNAPIFGYKDYNLYFINETEKRLYEPYRRVLKDSKKNK